MHFVKEIGLLFSITCIVHNSFSQIRGGNISYEDGRPVAFATIELQDQDSLTQYLTLTDTLGNFLIPAQQGPKYHYLIIRHLNLSDTTILLDSIKGLDTIHYLRIKLPLKSISDLNEVVITSERNKGFEKIPEGFVFSLNDQLNNGTVWDALKQTPMVSASNDGLLKMAGKQNVVVYINGSKTNLSGDDLYRLLSNMPANNIQKIELITSPGSRYEAEGMAGIINLRLKHMYNEGTSGSVAIADIQTRKLNMQHINGVINYNKGKVNSQLSLYGFNNKNNVQSNNYFNFLTTGVALHTTEDRQDNLQGIGGTLSNDFSWNEKDDLSLQITGTQSNNNNAFSNNRGDYGKLDIPMSLDSSIITKKNAGDRLTDLNIDINNNTKLDSLGSYLLIGGSYFYQQVYDNYNNYTANKQDSNGNKIDEESFPLFFNTDVAQVIKNYAGQIDYHKALNINSSLDFGAEINHTTMNASFLYAHNIDAPPIIDSSLSSYFNYQETVAAIYGQYSLDFSEQLSGIIGIRSEHTQINGSEIISRQEIHQNYWNIFPNISLSYQPSDNNMLGINISSRINRPNYLFLNPARRYITPTYYIAGNPLLVASRSINTEFSYIFNRHYSFIASYSYIKDPRYQFQIIPPGTDSIYVKQLNYNRNNIASFNFNVNKDFFNSYLQINSTLTANYSTYKSTIPELKTEESSWMGALNFRAEVKANREKNITIFTSYNLNTPTKDLTYNWKFWNTTDIGVSFKIQSFSLELVGQDIFCTDYNRMGTLIPYISSSELENYHDRQRLRLTLKYDFGNQRLKKIKIEKSANSEMRSRMKN